VHEGDIDGGVDGVEDGFFESLGRGHVVGDSADGSELRGTFHWLLGVIC
jgi:hypothetical protein